MTESSSTMAESLEPGSVEEWFASRLPVEDFAGRRVLVVVPDSTRTAPLPLLFGALHRKIGPVAAAVDVIVALGTHPAMESSAIATMLGIEQIDGGDSVGLFNHEWDHPGPVSYTHLTLPTKA